MIGSLCRHCKKGHLEPYKGTIEHWICPVDRTHTASFDEPGDCPDCMLRGKTTALAKAMLETNGYRCDNCGKTPLETVIKSSWCEIQYEAEEPRLGSVFIPKMAQQYGENLEIQARGIAPCGCSPRWGLIRISHSSVPAVRHVDGCCDKTIQALQKLSNS